MLSNPKSLETTVGPSSHRAAQKVLALAAISILLCAALLWSWENVSLPPFLERMTWFHVREVQIEAEWPLQKTQVQSWLPKLEGRNILGIRGAEIVKSLAAKPWVGGVTLKKEFPNRLLIEVTTKRAVAIEVDKAISYFIDGDGARIERTTPELLLALDLAVITNEFSASRKSLHFERGGWNLSEMVVVLERLQQHLNSSTIVSQLQLGSYPYFKAFLASPKLEVLFSLENWQSQLPILALILHNPPRQIGQPQKINLILPKKAVVSSILSN